MSNRPLHHKVLDTSKLSIAWFFRGLFWILFLISFGLSIGLAIGLYIQLAGIEDKDLVFALALGIILVVTFILWRVFLRVHQRRLAKEDKLLKIDYLAELKNKGALSEEDFLKEKVKILKN
jgi:hypothetical protein